MTGLWPVRESGCDCPPFVEQCAHIDGDTVILVDLTKLPDCPGDCKNTQHAGYRFIVGVVSAPWGVCSTRGCHQSVSPSLPGYTALCADEAEAVAAFHSLELQVQEEASK